MPKNGYCLFIESKKGKALGIRYEVPVQNL